MIQPEPAKEINISSWSFTLPTTTRLMVFDAATSNNTIKAVSAPFIPRGAGRSYGDAAYITHGITLSSKPLDQIAQFDETRGTIVCESGVEIIQLHRFLERTEWSFPIYGGTQWATIGGMLAADVHGKNDVSQGSFGNHVESIELIMPDGSQLHCSSSVRPDLFAATIGGMGLTGFTKSVTLKLQPNLPQTVRMRTTILSELDQVFAKFEESEHDFRFFSCAGCTGQPSDGGLYATASYSEELGQAGRKTIDIPLPTINLAKILSWQFGSQLCNIFHRRHYQNIDRPIHIEKFNYVGGPGIFKHFNKCGGSMIEYQFVVSTEHIHRAITDLLKMSRDRSLAGYGFALKKFGTIDRMGLLSFPKPGYSVNFWNNDCPEARDFLIYFTDYLLEIGGRAYLAKDSCILPRQFEAMYKNLNQWRDIVKRYDPANKVQSDLSRRLNMKPW